jgi:methionyl-tRNA synthetase
MKFYCVKCRKNVEEQMLREDKTKKGLRIAKGKCSICGTKLARILGK